MNMIPNIAVLGLRPSLTLLLAAICACAVGSVGHNAAMKATAPLRLDFSDDGKQLKLLVRHPEIGLVCELHWTNAAYLEFLRSIGYRARPLDAGATDIASAHGNVHTLARLNSCATPAQLSSPRSSSASAMPSR